MRLYLLFLFFIISPALLKAQDSYIKTIVAKDTVQHGEIYKCLVKVEVGSDDSIVSISIRFGDLELPVNKNQALVSFATFPGRMDKNFVAEKNFSLEIRLKTLALDTIISRIITYYVTPNQAYIRFLNDYEIDHKKYQVYPDVKSELKNSEKDFEKLLKSTFLRNRKGKLTFSFLIDTNGVPSGVKVNLNSFNNVSNDELINFIMATRWTTSFTKDIAVPTIKGYIIEL